jgi:hypothetical protein
MPPFSLEPAQNREIRDALIGAGVVAAFAASYVRFCRDWAAVGECSAGAQHGPFRVAPEWMIRALERCPAGLASLLPGK